MKEITKAKNSFKKNPAEPKQEATKEFIEELEKYAESLGIVISYI